MAARGLKGGESGLKIIYTLIFVSALIALDISFVALGYFNLVTWVTVALLFTGVNVAASYFKGKKKKTA